jgi:hypothetical protein
MADIGNEGKTIQMDIVFPNGIKGMNVSQATVKVSYPELATKIIEVKNLVFSKAFVKTPTISPQSLLVTFRGVPADVSSLTSSDIKGIITVSNIDSTGKIQLPVTFEFSSEKKISVIGKYQVSVNIK